MDAKKLALLIGALVVAAVTAVMAKHMSNNATAAPMAMAAAPVATGPQVLVATKPLPVGTILGPDSFRFQPWPKDVVDGAYFVQGAPNVDPGKMAGWVVRNALTAGQPLTQGSLVSPGDRGFLAAALTPGMRAVTLSVSGATAVAGFVFPGDHVDLVLTSNIDVNSSASTNAASPIQVQVHDNRPLQASETILRNVRVLATDQRTDNTPTPDGKTAVSNFSLVTVEVTPKLAEKLAVAQKIGALSLSLRPLSDDGQALAEQTAGSATRTAAGLPQDAGTSFTTGGEVSRFARSGMRSGSGGPSAPAAAPAAPIIRVARGNSITPVPLGIGQGVAAAGAAIPAAGGL